MGKIITIKTIEINFIILFLLSLALKIKLLIAVDMEMNTDSVVLSRSLLLRDHKSTICILVY